MADGPLPTEGVDYAFPPRPNIAQLAVAGKRFACRYGGPGSIEKQLDPAEAQALSAAGIAIVANAEGAVDGLLGGFSAGASWARSAEARFAACRMPPGRPIYFSVDFDVQSGQWAAVASGLRGAASVVGAARVGVYGGRRAIEWARRDGVAQWFWQTYAWSSGIWVPGNHIEQYRNGVQLAGADVDLDRALASDFGQWTIGDDMADGYDRDTAWRLQGHFAGSTTITVPVDDTAGSPPKFTEENKPQQQWDRIEAALAKVSTPPAATVDIPALVAALKPELDAATERAVRKVLGTLDGATPPQV